MSSFAPGGVVWVKCGTLFWPGEVKRFSDLPEDVRKDFDPEEREPELTVKFFDEDGYEFLNDTKNVYPYNCSRKEEFVKKGVVKSRTKSKEGATTGWFAKFPNDIVKCEILTNGDPKILEKEPYVERNERVNYKEIFKSPHDDSSSSPRAPKRSASGSSVSSPSKKKKALTPTPPRPISHPRFKPGASDHKVKILPQPSSPYHLDLALKQERAAAKAIGNNNYRCSICGFSASRLNVIVLHNKTHSNQSAASGRQSGSPVVKKNGKMETRTPAPGAKRSSSSPVKKAAEKKKPESPAKKRSNITPVKKRPRMTEKRKELLAKEMEKKDEKRKKILGDWSEDEEDEIEERKKMKESLGIQHSEDEDVEEEDEAAYMGDDNLHQNFSDDENDPPYVSEGKEEHSMLEKTKDESFNASSSCTDETIPIFPQKSSTNDEETVNEKEDNIEEENNLEKNSVSEFNSKGHSEKLDSTEDKLERAVGAADDAKIELEIEENDCSAKSSHIDETCPTDGKVTELLRPQEDKTASLDMKTDEVRVQVVTNSEEDSKKDSVETFSNKKESSVTDQEEPKISKIHSEAPSSTRTENEQDKELSKVISNGTSITEEASSSSSLALDEEFDINKVLDETKVPDLPTEIEELTKEPSKKKSVSFSSQIHKEIANTKITVMQPTSNLTDPWDVEDEFMGEGDTPAPSVSKRILKRKEEDGETAVSTTTPQKEPDSSSSKDSRDTKELEYAKPNGGEVAKLTVEKVLELDKTGALTSQSQQILQDEEETYILLVDDGSGTVDSLNSQTLYIDPSSLASGDLSNMVLMTTSASSTTKDTPNKDILALAIQQPQQVVTTVDTTGGVAIVPGIASSSGVSKIPLISTQATPSAPVMTPDILPTQIVVSGLPDSTSSNVSSTSIQKHD